MSQGHSKIAQPYVCWQSTWQPLLAIFGLVATQTIHPGRGALFEYIGPWPDQGVEPVHGFLGRPRDPPQQEHPEQRVVECPRVMTGDGDKDSPLARLGRPEQRPWFLVLNLGG